MGRTLAALHRSMADLATSDQLAADPVAADLEAVPALRVPTLADDPNLQPLLNRPAQLLHGDYAPGNLIVAGDELRILDLDDCGFGPPEFDIGNTLFMLLFDQTIDPLTGETETETETGAVVSEALDRYRNIRRGFIQGYNDEAGGIVATELVDAAIEARRAALAYWVGHLEHAPVGIASGSAEWHRRLRRFVDWSRAVL